MSSLTSHDNISFFIIIVLLLLSGKVLGELARKVKQPAVMGELIAGLLLGPSVFGHFYPSWFSSIFTSSQNAGYAFDALSRVGIILFLFIAGMEVHLRDIVLRGKAAAKISLTGILFPFGAGFLGTWFFYDHFFSSNIAQSKLIGAMFMGTALSITALSVLAKILIDLDLGRTRFGNLLLTAAMINDFAGWILFSIVINLAGMQQENLNAVQTIATTTVFTVLLLTIGRKIIDRLFDFSQKYLSGSGASLAIAIIVCLLGALFTEWVGIHAIFGAFLMGVAVGDSKKFSATAREELHLFVTHILAPLFFVSIGLRVNLMRDFNPLICSFVLLVACFGKLLGGIIGARLSGFKINKAIAVGFAMNARGSMEIVLGLIALQAKIINEQIFVALVVMTFITILITGPSLRFFLMRHEKIVAQVS